MPHPAAVPKITKEIFEEHLTAASHSENVRSSNSGTCSQTCCFRSRHWGLRFTEPKASRIGAARIRRASFQPSCFRQSDNVLLQPKNVSESMRNTVDQKPNNSDAPSACAIQVLTHPYNGRQLKGISGLLIDHIGNPGLVGNLFV